MKIIENYTFLNLVTQTNQTQKRIVTLNENGQRIAEEDFNGCSAEEWLEYQDFTSIHLVTLLYIKNQLIAAGKTSAKLNSVEVWINQILASFAQNPSIRSDWTYPPHSFNDTLLEAYTVLNS